MYFKRDAAETAETGETGETAETAETGENMELGQDLHTPAPRRRVRSVVYKVDFSFL